MGKIEYTIDEKIAPSEGLVFLGDTVTIYVESGNPGGAKGDFEEYMLEALQEWYGDYKVRLTAVHK